jgi:acyl-coenzyme A synthetase/AMP-(fatty) acid ligase
MISEPCVLDLMHARPKEESVVRVDRDLWAREVEGALYRHPAIRECAAMVIPNRPQGEEVVAFVSLRGTLTGWEQELRDSVRHRIGDDKTPQRIIILPEIPKETSGRVDHSALEDLISSLETGLDFVGS